MYRTINMRKTTGTQYTIFIHTNSTWKTGKDLLSKQTNIPSTNLVFYHRNKKLGDNDPISAVQLNEGEFILFCCKPTTGIHRKGDPYNYNEMVKYIKALNFSEEHVKAALDYFPGNLNRAVAMLTLGEVIMDDGF